LTLSNRPVQPAGDAWAVSNGSPAPRHSVSRHDNQNRAIRSSLWKTAAKRPGGPLWAGLVLVPL